MTGLTHFMLKLDKKNMIPHKFAPDNLKNTSYHHFTWPARHFKCIAYPEPDDVRFGDKSAGIFLDGP
jgi:hypothetical protein